jgi:hypothetical protein
VARDISLIGRRITGTVQEEVSGDLVIVSMEEMSESQFVLDPNQMWHLKTLLESVKTSQHSHPWWREHTDFILNGLSQNVLSGAKGAS